MTSSLKPLSEFNSGFAEKPASDWRARQSEEPETVLRTPRGDLGEVPVPLLPNDVPSVWRRLFPIPSDAGVSEAVADPAEGMSLGHFTIQRRIGAGAMGAVFLAYDDRLSRNVALKILSPVQAMDASTVQRFQNEAQAAARLDHDHIARVYYYGEENGLHFIAYEYIAGINLRDLLRQRGRLSPAEAVNFAIQITTALRHTSRNGVVHRDIKPSNIIVTPQGRAKLVDLGLAKRDGNELGADLTVAGTTLGTFDYISPEQARDPRAVDVRSDLYSLGCTLYHLLTGEPPYPEGTVLQKLLDHQAHETPDASVKNRHVSPALSTVIRKLMASDPRRRYATPEELLRDLAVIARGLGLRLVSSESAMLVPEARLQGAWWDRHLGWMITALALLISVVALQNVPSLLEHWTSPPKTQIVQTLTPSDNDVEHSPSSSMNEPLKLETENFSLNREDPLNSFLSQPQEFISANKLLQSESTTAPQTTPATTPAESASENGKPIARNEGTPSPGDRLKPGEPKSDTPVASIEAPASPVPEPTLPPISIVGSDSKIGFETLEAACEAAEDGQIIELRGTGIPSLSDHALRLINKHLTIRGATKGTSRRPVLEISESRGIVETSTSRMISVAGGSLQLRDIDLVAKVNSSATGVGWTLFALERPEQLKLDGVTITVLNPSHRPASVLELGSASPNASGKIGRAGLQSLPPEIQVSNSVIRGADTFLTIRDAISARFLIEDSLVAMDDSVMQMATRPAMPSGETPQFDLVLMHTTLILGNSLVVSRQDNSLNDRPMPLVVSAQNNLISIGRDQPLIKLSGTNTMDLSDSFKWLGKRNGYDAIQSFWIPEKSVPLNFSAWKSQWGGETTGSSNDPIRWKNAVRNLLSSSITPADVALDFSENAPNPLQNAADDGTDLGAPLQQLPTPPEVTSFAVP